MSRYLTKSLSENAKDFACKNRKVEGYNHYEIQKLYEEEGYDKLLELVTKPEAIEYLTMDVKVLEELFNKVRNIMLEQEPPVDICETPTIGSSAMKIFRQNLKKNKITLPVLTKDQHDFIRSTLIAGRSEAINGTVKIDKIVECVDVKSLYPSVVGGCGNAKGSLEMKILGFKTEYPYGECRQVQKREAS